MIGDREPLARMRSQSSTPFPSGNQLSRTYRSKSPGRDLLFGSRDRADGNELEIRHDKSQNFARVTVVFDTQNPLGGKIVSFLLYH
jgi:hypothetical protein